MVVQSRTVSFERLRHVSSGTIKMYEVSGRNCERVPAPISEPTHGAEVRSVRGFSFWKMEPWWGAKD